VLALFVRLSKNSDGDTTNTRGKHGISFDFVEEMTTKPAPLHCEISSFTLEQPVQYSDCASNVFRIHAQALRIPREMLINRSLNCIAEKRSRLDCCRPATSRSTFYCLRLRGGTPPGANMNFQYYWRFGLANLIYEQTL
jgi:hypothetical protein